MTDLEICKRIAEIEGLRVASPKEAEVRGYMPTLCVIILNGDYLGGSHSYKPLTNNTLCFNLMVKYKVERKILDGIVYYSIPFQSKMYQVIEGHDSKALCLAIIEANGETK
jgi:hypothetical protein